MWVKYKLGQIVVILVSQILDERSSLNNQHVFQFLSVFFPKVNFQLALSISHFIYYYLR